MDERFGVLIDLQTVCVLVSFQYSWEICFAFGQIDVWRHAASLIYRAFRVFPSFGKRLEYYLATGSVERSVGEHRKKHRGVTIIRRIISRMCCVYVELAQNAYVTSIMFSAPLIVLTFTPVDRASYVIRRECRVNIRAIVLALINPRNRDRMFFSDRYQSRLIEWRWRNSFTNTRILCLWIHRGASISTGGLPQRIHRGLSDRRLSALPRYSANGELANFNLI